MECGYRECQGKAGSRGPGNASRRGIEGARLDFASDKEGQ